MVGVPIAQSTPEPASAARAIPLPRVAASRESSGRSVRGVRATTLSRQSPMDAHRYFHLADSIASAKSAADLAGVERLVRGTEMHTIERHALERALRSRADLLRLIGDAVVAQPPPERAD